MAARLIAAVVFDHFLTHRIVTLSDFDDEKLVDADGQLLDATHPAMAEGIDWYFRIARRHQVLWFEFDLPGDAPLVLHSLAPDGSDDTFSQPSVDLSKAMDATMAQWLSTSRLPAVPALPTFSLDDLVDAARRLTAIREAIVAAPTHMQGAWLTTRGPLEVASLRVLAGLLPSAAVAIDRQILQYVPNHAVARRNLYIVDVTQGGDRRAILNVIADAPMYAKPRISLWGDEFGVDEFGQKAAVFHQGVAASLAPSNPYACHNYSVVLAEQQRREESYRWADRATVAMPEFGVAQLDCVRRLRQLGRPAQAFAEAQYRCRELIERTAAPSPGAEHDVAHHARLLLAFTYFDIGRQVEALELADNAIKGIAAEPALQRSFEWATKRVQHWRTDAGVLARAYAWDAYYRGDPGRAAQAMFRPRVSDTDDAAMLISSLIALGREDQACLASHHFHGSDGSLLGDGRGRLAASRAFIIAGDLAEAIEQIQIVQLRRSSSRFEAEINRLLRLASCRSATEWERVIARRMDQGAVTLARRAARDLADFVPRMDANVVEKALGARTRFAVDPAWIKEFLAAVPNLTNADGIEGIELRLRMPTDTSLKAADALAQEWWNILVPPAKDRDAHAAGALAALGIAVANYLALASGPANLLSGAYRHIATEALQLVRRSRYQLDARGIRALLQLMERLSASAEWLFDTWLLRIERCFDLEAEQGAYVDTLTIGMPTVRRMLRGDERAGWELRMAMQLGSDPSNYPAATTLFERAARAIEGGTAYAAWSKCALQAAPAADHIDVHWTAALANPSDVAEPWIAVGMALLDIGRGAEAIEPCARGVAALAPTHANRNAMLARLEASWDAANMDLPFELDEAAARGAELLLESEIERAIPTLQWVVARDPEDAAHQQRLAFAYCQAGRARRALQALGPQRQDAPNVVARMLLDCGRTNESFAVMRLAARRFRSTEAWITYAQLALMLGQDTVAADACRQAIATGARGDQTLLAVYAAALARSGEFTAAELEARRLMTLASSDQIRQLAAVALARSLAGQGRYNDATTFVTQARGLPLSGDWATDLIESVNAIESQKPIAARANPEGTAARQAFARLEHSEFAELATGLGSSDWGVFRATLAAFEYRGVDGVAVVPNKALDAAIVALARSEGSISLDAALLRMAALRIRENAFIQIDPPPPLGTAMAPAQFEQWYAERFREPRSQRASRQMAKVEK